MRKFFASPAATTIQVEHAFNVNWIDQNPMTFGRSVADILRVYPLDQWDIRFEPAYMPGETYRIVCTRKGA